jgi:3-phenylpropionate/trans-cinnamate dioxygenase ferredoxin reductase subunit
MTADPTLVIVGASLAGAKAAEGARSVGFDGRIVLLGEEQALPYERPPLSKTVLRSETGHETTCVHDESFYVMHDIELRTGRTVDAIDGENRRVHLDGGEWLPYTAAVLATGASPRRLEVPGTGLAGVHYLRTHSDSRRLSGAIRGAQRVAVIGAGWIGSEVAASARQMGADVVLIDPAPVPLHRVLGDEIGAVFSRLHTDNGVRLRLGTGVTALQGKVSVSHVALTDGTLEPADVVVVGVGVSPRVELATAAGLKVDNGIVVDEYLQSSASGIYAAGDVASAWHPHYGRHVRVEHWFNAIHQGLAAGANVVGRPTPYTELPYFFSDQYDLGMEYVGLSQPGDQVTVRGSLADREFIAFWHRDGQVAAAMNVNVWDVVDDLRAIVTNQRALEPALLADPKVALAELASHGHDATSAEGRA